MGTYEYAVVWLLYIGVSANKIEAPIWFLSMMIRNPMNSYYGSFYFVMLHAPRHGVPVMMMMVISYRGIYKGVYREIYGRI